MGKGTTMRHCTSCDSPFDKADSIKNGNYFLYLPIQNQIEDILGNARLYPYLTDRNLEASLNSTLVTDIITSYLYKDLITKHGLSPNDITLSWNTDGNPVFNSSNYSIWPLQASLNELPAHLRNKHILLLGLWFGQKPNMNAFLVPFVEECVRLETKGFIFGREILPRKIYALLLSADSPARAIVRNVKQFNGEFGCDWCEFEGVTVTNNSGPPVRYYPYRFPVVMRSARKQAAYAVQATAANPIKGVKGMTVADLLPTFDTVRGTVADYMHSVCQGVMQQMVDLWFDPKNHNESYYIGKKTKLVDERLQLISPPSEIHRSPRGISKRLQWKASEWRAFIFYSLVVLYGILPTSFLNHYFLFVYGIYTLLGDSISDTSIALSELCLTKFVIKLEELYGLSSCKFNVHCLTHLAHCVKDCGPLWATSAFAFESHNHVLINMFSGTQCVPQQITETFLMSSKVSSLSKICIDENSPQCVTEAIARLTNHARFKHSGVSDGLKFIGGGLSITLDALMLLALENLLNLTVGNRCGKMYNRFVYNHKFYSSIHYTRSKRHTNHDVSFQHTILKYGRIIGLVSIKPLCYCALEISQYCKCTVYNIVLVKQMNPSHRMLFRDGDFKVTSNFLIELEESDDIIAIYPSQIKSKCICINLGRRTYYCPLPYRIYHD